MAYLKFQVNHQLYILLDMPTMNTCLKGQPREHCLDTAVSQSLDKANTPEGKFPKDLKISLHVQQMQSRSFIWLCNKNDGEILLSKQFKDSH